MTVKEWLNRGYRLEREIRRLSNERVKAYERIFERGGNDGEKVQTSKTNRTEELYARYLEYDEKLNKRIDELYRVKAEILTAVDAVEDSLLREILIARYINFQKWETIADMVGYDVRHVYRLHRRALDMTEKMIFDVGAETLGNSVAGKIMQK